MLSPVPDKGPLKIFKQIFWRSPKFHVKQIYVNALKPNFWKYGFRNVPEVQKKYMHFWMWWSLNRDMERDEECPGWQFWSYELTVYIWAWRKVQTESKDWKDEWGVHPITFRNYRKFPLVRTVIDRKAVIEGTLREIFLTRNEAYNAPSEI